MADPSTSRRQRTAFNAGLQRSVALSLIAGGLGFAAVAILAAWLVTGVGHYTPRAVAPLLHEYLASAAAGDAAGAHRLLSQNALRLTPLAQLEAELADRERYAGFVGLRVRRIIKRDGLEGVPVETGQATATARYANGTRRQVDAILELEDGEWYIRVLAVGPPLAEDA